VVAVVLAALGACLTVAGVALVSVPAAVVVAGVQLVVAGYVTAYVRARA
jgi:hypothetical protein